MDKASKESTIRHLEKHLSEVKRSAEIAGDYMEDLGDKEGAKTARRWAREASETGPNRKGDK